MAIATFSSGFKRPNRSASLSILRTAPKQNHIAYYPNKILQRTLRKVERFCEVVVRLFPKVIKSETENMKNR
jgi:hypothetical protein